jgi:hypothetical protein
VSPGFLKAEADAQPAREASVAASIEAPRRKTEDFLAAQQALVTQINAAFCIARLRNNRTRKTAAVVLMVAPDGTISGHSTPGDFTQLIAMTPNLPAALVLAGHMWKPLRPKQIGEWWLTHPDARRAGEVVSYEAPFKEGGERHPAAYSPAAIGS